MKTKIFLFFLLISLLGINQVKSDTIHYQLPHSTENLCVDADSFPTFILYKPNGFGITTWKLNSEYYKTGDSVIYTPTNTESFDFSATCYESVENVILIFLYSQPPVHANFITYNNNGIVSSTNDTIWKCSNTITIYDGIEINDATSEQWTGPNGYLFSGSNNATISDPGMYTFSRSNPCGITTDTFLLIQAPNQLPTLQDTTFCNEEVDYIIDPGAGFNYEWSTGDVTQTINVTSTGTYTVTLTNACVSGEKSIVVSHEEFPLPELTPYPDGVCPGIIIFLEAHPTFVYDSYSWTQNGSDIGGYSSSINYLANPSTDIVGVRVTKGNCYTEANQPIIVYYPHNKPEICIVSVNTDLTKNMVVWEFQNENSSFKTTKDHYAIYKWRGGQDYDSIGFVPVLADQDNIFIDQSSNPPSISARYKIALTDACKTSSQLSNYHQTILLSASQGNNPGEISLIWNPYVEEENLFQVQQYQIWRGDSPNTMELYNQTPFTAYNDVGVFTQKYYQIAAIKPGGCNPAPNKSLIVGSFSNISQNNATAIAKNDNPQINIYPNPSSGIFQIEGKISSLEVFDNFGRLIFYTNEQTFDLTTFGKGVYYAKIQTANGPAVAKLIVQ